MSSGETELYSLAKRKCDGLEIVGRLGHIRGRRATIEVETAASAGTCVAARNGGRNGQTTRDEGALGPGPDRHWEDEHVLTERLRGKRLVEFMHMMPIKLESGRSRFAVRLQDEGGLS